MGGGSYHWLTPQGMIAAGIAHNPDYGKMAADGVAKEVAERNLIPATASAPAAASAEQQVSPAAGTDEVAILHPPR
jgi:hypothetical protein